MSADKQKLEDLFEKAVAITYPAERAAIIAGACGTDAALREE